MTNALPTPLLAGCTREFEIDTIMHQARSGYAMGKLATGDRQLMGFNLPPWQRPLVWTEAQKVSFIEGIFLGLGTGYYVTHQTEWDRHGEPLPMSGWLLDGQQRISSIDDFVNDRIAVFEGIRYSQLDRVTQIRRFRNQSFPCIEIPYQSDEGRLMELYRRLNFSGTAHTLDEHVSLGAEHDSP